MSTQEVAGNVHKATDNTVMPSETKTRARKAKANQPVLPGHKLIKRRDGNGKFSDWWLELSNNELKNDTKLIAARDQYIAEQDAKRANRKAQKPSTAKPTVAQVEAKPASQHTSAQPLSKVNQPATQISSVAGQLNALQASNATVSTTTQNEPEEKETPEAAKARKARLKHQQRENRYTRKAAFGQSIAAVFGIASASALGVETVKNGDVDEWLSDSEAGDDNHSDTDDDDDDDDDDDHHHHHHHDISGDEGRSVESYGESHDKSSSQNDASEKSADQTATKVGITAVVASLFSRKPKSQVEDLEKGQIGTEKSPATATTAPVAPSTKPKPVPKTATGLSTYEKKRHGLRGFWHMFGSYFLAACAVVLPALFIALGAGIWHFDQHTVSSSWSRIEQGIKVGVSLWSVVFAAVVSQALKAFAAYHAERGIRLRRLEQLMESTNLGSAFKTSFFSRQFDWFTFGLFLTWLFSPFGSQALQRSYSTTTTFLPVPAGQNYSVPVYITDTLGANAMFSKFVPADMAVKYRVDRLQSLSVFYGASLVASSIRHLASTSSDQDNYDNLLVRLPEETVHASWGLLGNETLSAFAGLPFTLPEPNGWTNTNDTIESYDISSVLNEGTGYEDYFNFVVPASYFNLTCSDWEIIPYEIETNAFNNMYFEAKGEFGISMVASDVSIGNRLAIASKIRNITNVSRDSTQIPPSGTYAVLECFYDRNVIEMSVGCTRSQATSYIPSCAANSSILIETNNLTSSVSEYGLADFAEDWITSISSSPQSQFAHTYTEIFLSEVFSGGENSIFNLSQTTSGRAEYFLQILFNTWINLGYNTDSVVTASATTFSPPTEANAPGQYEQLSADTQWLYSRQLFVIDRAWLTFYLFCAVALLLVGVASLVVEAQCVAPESMTNNSAVSRRSKYLSFPAFHPAEPKVDRMRRVGDVCVMVQDVAPDNRHFGKMRLGNKPETEEEVRKKRLRKGLDREYR